MHALTPILAFFNTVDLTDEQRKELNEEAILMASLRHPCICQFFRLVIKEIFQTYSHSIKLTNARMSQTCHQNSFFIQLFSLFIR